MTPPSNATIAAVDIGTNSLHLVVARAVDGAAPEVLAREKIPVRLGSGRSDMKRLAPEAIERAVQALDHFRQIAAAHDAELVAVATSAVREAENQAEFINRAADAAGVRVAVISGVEEARLIHLGAISAVPVAQRRHLVIDIGGGSTEVVIAETTKPLFLRSLKLGHIRLSDRFFPNGEVTAQTVKQCRRYVRAFLAPVAQEVSDVGFELVVGCSGTIENLSRIAAAANGQTPRTVDNLELTRKDLDRVVAILASHPNAAERGMVDGLDSQRSDVIVGGAILLRQLFASFDINTLTVSPSALREGVLLDRLRRRTPSHDPLHHLGDLRRSSVLAVARRFDEDLDHAQHATDLALELFDATRPQHGLEQPDRDLLEAAGLLHNIGRFVAHAAHHKHSYYLIRHSEHLAGLTENEIELVAQVARYHRKSNPRPKHREFASLHDADQRKVQILAGLLRIAIGLDRTYREAVSAISAKINTEGQTEELVINAHTNNGVDIELELFTARERSGLLADILSTALRIEQHTDAPTSSALA